MMNDNICQLCMDLIRCTEVLYQLFVFFALNFAYIYVLVYTALWLFWGWDRNGGGQWLASILGRETGKEEKAVDDSHWYITEQFIHISLCWQAHTARMWQLYDWVHASSTTASNNTPI